MFSINLNNKNNTNNEENEENEENTIRKSSWDKKYCIHHTGTGKFYSLNGVTDSLFSDKTKLFKIKEEAFDELKEMERYMLFPKNILSRLDVSSCYVERVNTIAG